MFSFKIIAKDKKSFARAGVIKTPHGEIETPAFIAVGTQGTVKSLTPEDLEGIGVQVVLGNTYHLYLRPGDELVAQAGGLHKFMNWNKPLITDSGGFQVFSLGLGLEHGVSKIGGVFPSEELEAPIKQKPKLVEIDEEGATFTSHLDGSKHRLTPEKSIKIQENLGADIILAFDECTSPLSSYEYQKEAMGRTHCWAQRCLEAKTRKDQALFGIIQGGEFKDLREKSAKFISSLPFEGFAVGGSFGKSKQNMFELLSWMAPMLPEDKPRHLLGIGEPEDFRDCVAQGMDLFDCVIPTRLARHGAFLTKNGRLNILNAEFFDDFSPIETECRCYTCLNFTRAYLQHLFKAKELLAYRLASVHNLYFVVNLVKEIRKEIIGGEFGK